MAKAQEIAKLFGTLGFNVETKNLVAFEKKLDEVEQRLLKLRAATKEAIKVNVSISATSQKEIARSIRNAVKDAGNTSKLTIKDINISGEAIRRAFKANSKGLSLNVKMPATSVTIKSLRDSLKHATDSLELKIKKVWVSKTALQQAVNEASVNTKLKLLNVQVDQNALKQSIDAALSKYRGMLNPRVGSPGRAGGGAGAHLMAFGGGALGGALSNAGGLLGGAAAAYGVGSLNRMNQELQAVELSLGAVTDSEEEAAKKLKMLSDMGLEMGKTLRQLGPQYVQILAATKGTAIEGDVDNIFRGFLKYGTVMGLDDEAMKGSFRAISQMVSKQQVYAEELRGQLAERLPAAVRIAAEVTTGGDTKKLNKMMEAGELDPNELLPKMAKYMEEMANANGAYNKALETSRVAQGRFNWQLEQSVKLFAKSGFDEGMKKIFESLQKFLANNTKGVEALGRAFNYFGTAFQGVLTGIQVGVGLFSDLANKIGLSSEAFIMLAGTAATLLMPFTRLFTMFSMLALAVEDIYVFTQGGDSLFGRWFDSLDPETTKSLESMFNSIMRLGESLGKLASMSLDGWQLIWETFKDSGGLKATADAISSIADAITKLVDALSLLPARAGEIGLINAIAEKFGNGRENPFSPEEEAAYRGNLNAIQTYDNAQYHARREQLNLQMGEIVVRVSGVTPEEIASPDWMQRYEANVKAAMQLATEASLKGKDFVEEVKRTGINMQDQGG